jgi:hypothetical protein
VRNPTTRPHVRTLPTMLLSHRFRMPPDRSSRGCDDGNSYVVAAHAHLLRAETGFLARQFGKRRTFTRVIDWLASLNRFHDAPPALIDLA